MQKESLKNKAYNLIKTKIVNCEYPPNSFLNETLLMDEIGSSRTPIREALSKLEQENLVRILPKKGIMVSDLSINEISMIFETRILIEPYIVAHYGQLVPSDILSSMKKNFDLKNLSHRSTNEIYVKDDQFHKLLVNSSKNLYFMRTMDYIYNQNFRLRVMTGNQNQERILASNNEHVNIIDLMLGGKFDEAGEAIKTHLEKAREASFSSFINHY